MPREKFPEGLKIREREGPGELIPLLKKLKKYSFQGYIRAMVGEELEGYITLKDGQPQNALIYTPSGKEIGGEDALKKIKEMDERDDVSIEARTNIDIDELISEAGGKIGEDIASEIEVLEEELKDVEPELEESGEEVWEDGETEKVKEEEEKLETEKEEKERQEKEMQVYDMIIQEEEKGGPAEEERNTFRNFIEGENNEFAYKAARKTAENPGQAFNPLLIVAGTGLGKTHLLKAIMQYLKENAESINITYDSTEQCTSELLSSDGERERYYEADLILLDDIQFLVGEKENQEALYKLFNHLSERNKQMIFSSDRFPEEIPSIDEKLTSRLKSGLVVDIEPPEYKTRLQIIKKQIKKQDQDFPEEVQEFLAKKIKKNVREMKGAVNRLIALSSLLDRPISVEVARENLPFEAEEEEETEDEDEELPSEIELEPGRSYIIEEERPKKAFEMVSRKKDTFKEISIFSRINPERIRSDYGLEEAEILWLTDKDSEGEETVPPNLENITWRLEETVEKEGIVLLDGVEYLIGQTGFDAAIQFIRHTIDTISETDTIFLLTVSSTALKDRHISILERELEMIS